MNARGIVSSLLLCTMFLSSGCASLLITGASGGVAYTITNVAYKTVCYPVDRVAMAMNMALKKMGIREVERKKDEGDVEIRAVADELTVYIGLERITAKTTKIAIDARKKILLKDKATALAIIDQAIKILEGKA